MPEYDGYKKHKELRFTYRIVFALLGFSTVVTEIIALAERGYLPMKHWP